MADKYNSASAAEKRRQKYDDELDAYLARRSAEMEQEAAEREERLAKERARPTATAGSPNTRGRYRPLDVPVADEEQGVLGALVDKIQSGVQRSASGALGTIADSDNPMLRQVAGIGGFLDAISDPTQTTDELARNLDPTLAAQDDSKLIYDAARANEAAQKPAYDKFMSERGWLGKQATEAVFDVAGSPTSALSVIGGPAGAIGVGDVYAQTYAEMRRQGFSKEEAETRAGLQAAPELIGLLPSGKVLGKIPGVGKIGSKLTDAIASPWLRGGAKVSAAIVGEGLEEGATQVLQFEADRGLSKLAENELLREYAAKQTPDSLTDYWGQVWRATKAGGVGGATLQTPVTVMQEIADAGRRAGALDQLADDADIKTIEREKDSTIQLPSVEEQIKTLQPTGFAGLVQAEKNIQAELAKPAWQRQAEAVEAARTEPAIPVTGAGIAPPAPISGKGSGRRRRAAAPVVAEETGSETLSADDLKSFAGLQQQTDNPITDLTAGQVIRTVKNKLGPRNVNAVGKLLRDGNLKVVDDVSEIPAGAVEGGAGYYDGKNTYIVANKLNKDNLMGDILNVVAHETKHGGDVGGQALRPTIGEFIGTKANEGINKKIEAAADSGYGPAVAAREAAKKGSTPETYALELPAYFINTQRLAREQKGGGARIAQNIVSAVRTGYKRIKGGDIDINLDDVAYLSDKLVQEAALSGKPLEGNIDSPLAMIMGKNSTGYEQAEREGRAFKDPADGKMKYITSDAASRIKMTEQDYDEMKPPKGEKTGFFRKVSTILDHPELLESYPGLGEVVVQADKTVGRGGAQFSEQFGGIISVAPDVLEDIYKGDAKAKAILIHELQHVIQSKEDFARGGSPEQFLGPTERGLIDSAKFYEDQVNKQAVAMDDLYPLIPYEKARGAVRRALNQRRDGIISNAEAFDVIMENLEGKEGLPKDVADWLVTTEIVLEKVKDVAPKRTAALNEAEDKYMTLRGEQEARFVQKNADKKLEDLPLTPLDDAEYQGETRVSKRVGDITKSVPANQPLAVNLDDLKSAMQKMYQPAKKSPVGKIITGLVDYTGGLGKQLGSMRELADGSAALYSHRAMNAYANIEQQFKNMAKRGVKEGKYKNTEEGMKAIRADTEKRLDAIAKLPTPQRRESALAALVRENPYMAPISDAYSQIDQLTRTLIGQMLQADPNPTPEELKLMSTMRNNSFGYTTRMYAAFQGPAGRSHSKKLIKEYDKAAEALANGKQVPEKFKESFRVYTNAAKYIIDNDLTIPEGDALWELDREKIANLYDTWVGTSARTKANAIKVGKDQGMTDAEAREYADEVMLEELDQVDRKEMEAEFEGKARDVINGMLGIEESTGPFAQYYRGFRQDRSILERRERVPEEIKELFGEITDPATRLSVTIAKQGELAARTKLLLDMKKHGLGKWVVPAKDAGKKGNEDFTFSLDGETFGPLRNYRTTPMIAQAIGENLEMFTSLQDAVAKSFINATKAGEGVAGKVVSGIQKGAAAQKMLSIVAEPFGTLMNAVGSPVMLLANGVTNPKTIANAVKTGGQSILDTAFSGRGELSPDLEEAIKYGILDSARVQEIRRSPQKFVKGLVTSKPKLNRAGRGVKTVINTGTELFAMSDAWVKVAAFKDRSDTLAKFYAAEGIKKTDAEIKEEAADTIKNTNISYGRTMPGVRMIESLGITSFLPYFISVPRSLAYNTVVGYKDLVRATGAKTLEGRMALGMAGIKRLAGTAAATGGIVAGTKALAAALNGEDDDKLREAKKVMRPDARFGDSIYLGKDSKGNPLFFRLSRIDPYGPINDMFRILVDPSVNGEQARHHIGQSLKDLLFANRLTSAVASLGANLITDEQIQDNETKLERISPKATQPVKDMMLALGADYSTANSMIKVLDTMTPGWFDSIDPSNPKVQDGKDGWYEALGDFVRWSGGRVDKADPGSYAFQVGKEIDTAKKEGRKQVADSLKADYSDERMLKVVQRVDNELFDKRKAATDLYEGMTKGLDMSPSAARQLLKDKANLTEADIAAATRGRTLPNTEAPATLSASSLEMRLKNQKDKMTEEEYEKEKKKNKEFLDKMRAAGYKVGE